MCHLQFPPRFEWVSNCVKCEACHFWGEIGKQYTPACIYFIIVVSSHGHVPFIQLCLEEKLSCKTFPRDQHGLMGGNGWLGSDVGFSYVI